MSGKSEFPLRITKSAIAEISDRTSKVPYDDPQINRFIVKGAPYADVDIVRVLRALTEYMTDRNVQPDFTVVLDE